ncbi:hypothetical protein Tco_0235610 [Tanacetum coccineum]
MSRQGRRCLKSSNSKMLERHTKVKRKACKSLNRSGSGRGVQANEEANSGASHVKFTNGKGGTYRLFGGCQRNGKRSPDEGKRS